jgi:SAM-dependent methyltransferase
MRASLLLCFAFACSHSAPQAGEHHHGFSNAQAWAKSFDDPGRDAWQKPDEVIRALALPPDALVADVGSGTGYFTVRLARAAPQGKVYGADIEPDMVKYLSERAHKEGLPNVVSILAAPDDPRLPEPVDLVLVVDTYHHIDDRPAYFARLRQKLRPGGRVAVVDFRRGQPMGPPDEHKIPPAQLKDEMAQAGYGVSADYDFLPNQYFLVFAPR